MPADAQQIIRERGLGFEQQQTWRIDWQDLADLAMPAKSDILSHRQPGTRRTERVFDTTLAYAVDTFAGHLYSSTTNFVTQWFSLNMRALPDSQRAHQWLDAVAKAMYLEMVADDSQVPQSIFEAMRQYALFGTGACFTDEQPPGINPTTGFRGFQAFAPDIGTYYPSENASGRVDTLYRDLKLSPRQAEQQFGLDALPRPTQDLLRDPMRTQQQDTPEDYIHCVKPRRARDRARDDARNMAFESAYVHVGQKQVVDEGGFPWFPYQVFRWQKLIPHAPYGFGRGHLAMPEGKTLNIIDQDVLRALPGAIGFPPAFLIGESQDTAGKVSLLAGAMNPLAAGAQVVPYPSQMQVQVEALQVQQRQERINRAFFLDQLSFLPPPSQRTQRTLGELLLRQREMARIMGPAFLRLLSELLNPFIDVCFGLLLHARALPEPPPEVIEAAIANEGTIDVEYTGPLARAQKDTDAEAIAEGVEFLLAIFGQTGDRTIFANIDFDDSVARFLEVRGFPKGLITDRRMMEEIRSQAQQQAQQQAQLNQGQQVAEAAGSAAPMLTAVADVAQGGAAA